jgi:hypothetical protein
MKADEFKVGDTVYCVIFGKGTVKSIDIGDYPVFVEFFLGNSMCIIAYTQSGKFDINGLRTLFFEEIPIPESAYKRPRWRADIGTAYYYINAFGDVTFVAESEDHYDNKKFNIGNYFKTEEEAKESKFYKVFHEED